MKQKLEDYLASKDVLHTNLPSYFSDLLKTIPFHIPDRMKAVIAVSELITYSSQFRKSVQIANGTLVPVNAITFCIAGSGGHKDSSLRTIRNVFKPSYNLIINERIQRATDKAIAKAKQAGEDFYNDPSIYGEYYEPPVPIFIKDITPQGLIQYMNDISSDTIGTGLITNSEIADEFNTNQQFPEVIKVLSEVYDLGIVEASYTKSKELRNDGVHGIPVNALFIGSHYMIMFNSKIKTKVIESFMSKFGRRSFFCYIPETIVEPEFDSIEDMLETEHKLQQEANDITNSLATKLEDVTNHNITNSIPYITIDNDANYLLSILRRYDTEIATNECKPESVDFISRKNRYWKTLKLAGALALYHKSDTITEQLMKDAIIISNLFLDDVALFEADLAKADHERFIDFVKPQAINKDRIEIPLHTVKKQGFMQSVTKPKLEEFISLCSSLDKHGVYYINKQSTAIVYEPLQQTEQIGVTYKQIDTTLLNKAIESNDKAKIREAKGNIAKTVQDGLEFTLATFNDLHKLFSKSYAFSPFEFKEGIRNKSNLIPKTKWIVFDIDSSSLTAEEVHLFLSDLNHYIVLGSNPTNFNKFHVAIELDSYVSLSPVEWKVFYKNIAEYLALEADQLPQSQIFFSYGDRPLFYNLDGIKLPVHEFILQAKTEQPKLAEDLPDKQKQLLLNDKFNTFHYAFNADYGEGSRAIIRAVYHAKDLGASLEYALQLFDDIQQYWDSSFNSKRYDEMKKQITRIFN